VHSSGNPDVLGSVAERLAVPAELTDAVAGLLGERLEAVVTTEPGRLSALLEELRRGKKGRVALLPVRPAYVAGAAATLRDLAAIEPALREAVLGRAAELVQYGPEDEPLVRALFGSALVVSDVASALLLSRQAGVVAVALDGTVVDPSGVVTGGSVAAPQIERRREIGELRAEIAERTAQVAELAVIAASEAERVAQL